MEEKKLICINCPLGCALTVAMRGNEIEAVKGNTCRRGEIYARKELTNPTRIVTSTVRVIKGCIGLCKGSEGGYCRSAGSDRGCYSR